MPSWWVSSNILQNGIIKFSIYTQHHYYYHHGHHYFLNCIVVWVITLMYSTEHTAVASRSVVSSTIPSHHLVLSRRKKKSPAKSCGLANLAPCPLGLPVKFSICFIPKGMTWRLQVDSSFSCGLVVWCDTGVNRAATFLRTTRQSLEHSALQKRALILNMVLAFRQVAMETCKGPYWQRFWWLSIPKYRQ